MEERKRPRRRLSGVVVSGNGLEGDVRGSYHVWMQRSRQPVRGGGGGAFEMAAVVGAWSVPRVFMSYFS